MEDGTKQKNVTLSYTNRWTTDFVPGRFGKATLGRH